MPEATETWRLLVVDPSAELRDYVRAGLADFDVMVFEAADGREALAAAERLAPHLVLANDHLRRIDGLELARRLSREGGPPVLVMGPVTAAHASAAGACGVLPKPFDQATLQKWLGSLLAGLEAEGERRPEASGKGEMT